MTNDIPRYGQFSLDFYRERASEYAALRQVFANCSHPEFREDRDLYHRLAELVAPGPGLDAGCGAGALEMSYLTELGFEMFGLDAVPENVEIARSGCVRNSRSACRVADLREPLPFDDAGFPGRAVQRRDTARSPRGGVWQGAAGVCPGAASRRCVAADVQAGAWHRYSDRLAPTAARESPAASCLYDEAGVTGSPDRPGTDTLIGEMRPTGGWAACIYFDDNKPMRHCVFWARKG